MAARLLVLLAAFSFVMASLFVPVAVAQEEAVQPDVPNAKFHFAGTINTNAVYIRSGPSQNYYATIKVDKGSPITVVGIKFDWLKITPPEGSFSVISKAFVQKNADGSTGTVIGDNVRVRAGSDLTPIKVTVQCLAKRGDQVNILGEQEEYYQITPPPGAFLYVHQKYVDPVKQLPPGSMADATGGNVTPTTQPTTQPAETVVVKPVLQQDTPAQQAAKAEAEFDRLESALKTSLDKSLEEQPLSELLAGYESLLKNDQLSVPMRRMSEIRMIGLRAKHNSQQELLATRKQQQEAMARIEALRTDRAAIEQRLAGGVVVYTAVGKLQASTLQVGQGTLYRLTDPATGRTLCYVRSEDTKYATFLDKFVGVKGDLVSDAQLSLKSVSATDIAEVDPAKVNKGISAQLTPASLLTEPAKTEQASTDSAPAN